MLDFVISPAESDILKACAETPEGLQVTIYLRARKPRTKSHPEIAISANPYSKEINDAAREATIVYLNQKLGDYGL